MGGPPGTGGPGGPAGGADAAAAVATPGLILLIAAGLGTVIGVIGNILQAVMALMSGAEGAMITVGTSFGGSVVGLIFGGVTIYGAMQLRALKSYNLAMAACILGCLPCGSGACCLLGAVGGIWSLVTIMKPEVKAAFK